MVVLEESALVELGLLAKNITLKNTKKITQNTISRIGMKYISGMLSRWVPAFRMDKKYPIHLTIPPPQKHSITHLKN